MQQQIKFLQTIKEACLTSKQEEISDTVLSTMHELVENELWLDIDTLLGLLKKDIEFFIGNFLIVILSFLDATVCFKSFLKEYEDLEKLVYSGIKNSSFSLISDELVVGL